MPQMWLKVSSMELSSRMATTIKPRVPVRPSVLACALLTKSSMRATTSSRAAGFPASTGISFNCGAAASTNCSTNCRVVAWPLPLSRIEVKLKQTASSGTNASSVVYARAVARSGPLLRKKLLNTSSQKWAKRCNLDASSSSCVWIHFSVRKLWRAVYTRFNLVLAPFPICARA